MEESLLGSARPALPEMCIRDRREPAVAAAPEHAAKVVHPIERPAVEEQTGVGIVQILDVHQHLLNGCLLYTSRCV